MKKTILFCSLIISLLATTSIWAQDSNKLTTRKVSKSATIDRENYKNFRFALGGGYSYWLGEDVYWGDHTLNDFNSDLRHGYNLDVDVQYYFHQYMGIGINGNFARYSNDETSRTSMKETDKMLFVGAMFNARFLVKKWGFYAGTGFGPLFYSGEATIKGINAQYDKTVFAMNSNIACEYKINETIGAGLKLSITAGSFKIDYMSDRVSTSSFMVTGFLSFKTK